MPAASQPEQAPQPGQVPAAFRKDTGTLIGQAAGAVVAQALAPVLANVASQLSSVLQQMPAAIAQASVPACAKCAYREARFKRVNGDVIQLAWNKACQDAGADPASPGAPVDFTGHLPAELRPDPASPVDETRMPTVFTAVTQLGGTWLCQHDIAADEANRAAQGVPLPQTGAPVQPPAQPAAGARPILVAPAGMSAHTAAAAAKVNVPGVPGYASP
jgi:hypothetical protein